MIEIKYDRTENSTRVITNNLSSINNLLPIKVIHKNIITDEIHYETDLYSYMWSVWFGAELITDTLILSNDGKLLSEFKWDVTIHGDTIEKTLWYYLKSRNLKKETSNGLIIGTHDGRNGHWIYPIKHGISNATLVEGNEKQFNSLRDNYKNYQNVALINEVVTIDGLDVDWYEGGEGYTDTIKKDLIYSWLPENQISSRRKTTISINQLIKSDSFDWLHLDVEGVDAELIMELEEIPNIIIYESMNLGEEEKTKLSGWFEINSYITFEENGNTIAIKKS